MRRQDFRDEYKWVRDTLANHIHHTNRPIPLKKKGLKLSTFLGVVLVGVSLAFIALAMFK